MTPAPNAQSFVESVKAIGRYLTTPAGLGSAVPAVITIADATLNVLRIPPIVRPMIYFLMLFAVLFAFYYETARYVTTKPSDSAFALMNRRATIHFAAAAGCIGSHLTILTVLNAVHPPWELLVNMCSWLAAGFAAGAAMELTRAFVILGLKMFIVKERGMPPAA